MERQRWLGKLLMSGSSGKQNVAMVKEMISSYCGAYPAKSSTAKTQRFLIQRGRDNFIHFHQI